MRQTFVTTILLGLLVVVVAGCVVYQSEPLQETPVPPTWLLSLPRSAQINLSCHNDFGPSRGEVVVWELPGMEPSDPNSAYMGDRGKRLGTLPDCTEVIATDFAWSKTDQEFWIYIKTDDLEGWISLDLVERKQ